MQAPATAPQSAIPNSSAPHASTSFQPQPDPTSSPSIGTNPPPQPPPANQAQDHGQPPIITPTFASINHPHQSYPNGNQGPSYPQQWYPPNYYSNQPRHLNAPPNAPYPNPNAYNRYQDHSYSQQPYAPIYHQTPYGAQFPHVPLGAGGPGPATMQNGYAGYQADGYHPMPYGYQSNIPMQPDGIQQYPSQPNGPEEGDAPAIQQHLPPHAQPVQTYPTHDQQTNPNHINGQASFPPNIIQQHQPFHPSYPPNHPYAYGVGVGFPQYTPHQTPYGAYGAYGDNYAPPAPYQNGHMSRPGPSSNPGKGLNPAAQGFNFQPAGRSQLQSFPNRNGDSSALSSIRTEQRPVFPSIAVPEQTTSTIPNGHADPKQSWVPPVIADGEKLKTVLAEQRLPEQSQPGGLGLSEVDGGTESTVPSSPPSDPTASTSATASTSTPAMSSSPTTATTPTSVQTPRPTTDGDSSFITSPKQSPAVQPDAGWTFGGEGLSGLTSPLANGGRNVSGLSTRSASGSSSKPRGPAQPLKTGPLQLSAGRPDNSSTAGNVYSLSLGGSIPPNVKTEQLQDSGDASRASTKGKGAASGKRIVFAAGVEGVRTSRQPVKTSVTPLVFGSAIDVPEPTQSVAPTSAVRSVSAAPVVDRPTTPEPKAASQSEATTPQPRAKPFSWAAAVRGSQAPSPAISSVPSKAASPARSTISLAGENEAGPSRLPVSPSAEPTTPRSTGAPLPPPSTGASAAPGPRPAFNYAAAAAAGAALSPQEELARLLADGIKGKGRELASVNLPRGLINTGNMCFANTILQVLVYCQPFTDLFEELGKRLKADLARKTPLLEAMIIFLREFNASTPIAGVPTPNGLPNGTSTPKGKARDSRVEAFIPENVYDAMKENKRFDSMRRGHQEDAEEYLGFFLNTLHEELLYVLNRTQTSKPRSQPNGIVNGDEERQVERPVSPGAADDSGWLEVGKKQKTHVVRNTETRESAITKMFGGTLRSLLHTPGQKDSVTLEPYQPLQLDIQDSNVSDIIDALKHISEPEIVPGVWSTAKNKNVDATKQVYIETFPNVLMLHLKRFVYDSGERNVVKRSKPVAYGTELIIPPEVISPSKRSSGTNAINYKLFGVVYHHGTSASGGHYTVSVSSSSSSSSNWIHFDDENVSNVPTSEVVVSKTEAESGKAGLIGGREKCAYLLFYQRVR